MALGAVTQLFRWRPPGLVKYLWGCVLVTFLAVRREIMMNYANQRELACGCQLMLGGGHGLSLGRGFSHKL